MFSLLPPRLARPLAVVTAIGCFHCGPDEPTAPLPPTPLPPLEAMPATGPGPYGVGVMTTEGLRDIDGATRTLPIEIWYPATITANAPPAIYELGIGSLTLAEYPSPIGAVRDAPVDHRGSRHPVVVFSHGLGGTRLQSIYLTEYLASHGFVVAAVDHVGNTFVDQLNPDRALSLLEAARLRPGDVSKTLDVLLELDGQWPGSRLAYAIDPSRVAIAGHSFGGFTTYRIAGGTIDSARGDEFCAERPNDLFCRDWPPEIPFPASQKDERFRAALAQTPGGAIVFEEDGLAEIDIPIMIQAGLEDRTTKYTPEASEPFAKLGGPAYLLTLDDAGHFTFSDMCQLMEIIGATIDSFDDGCSEAQITPTEAHPLINALSLAFLRRHLLGQDADMQSLLPTEGAALESK